jgi:hypothetical protein
MLATPGALGGSALFLASDRPEKDGWLARGYVAGGARRFLQGSCSNAPSSGVLRR